MSTFEYLWPVELLDRLNDRADYRRTVGRQVAVANWATRTGTGRMRRPELNGREHGYLKNFKTLDRVVRVTEDADPGTVEIFYTDGTSEYATGKDLVCVERPVMPVHYGHDRTACGELGEYDTVTTNIPSITCKTCNDAVRAEA